MANSITWDDDQSDPQQAQTDQTSVQQPGIVWDDDKYGSLPQQALAGLEGLGRGVLGPIAPAVERGVGINPQDIRARQEQNPITSGLGEAVGFAGSMLTGTGEGALIGKLGEAASAGIEGASTISKIASSGIKTGAEMAALQASDEASKAIVEQPGQSLGQAAINVGLSGIIGGAGGAIIGAVSPLWRASMESVGAPKILDDAKAQYSFRQGLPNGGDVPSAITDELSSRLGEMDNLRTQMGTLKGDALSRAMPDVTPESSAKINDQIQNIASQMSENIDKASNNAYLKSSVPKLAQDFQDFLEVVTDPNSKFSDKFEAINDLKKSQQAKSRYNLTSEDTALGDFTKNMARDLRLATEDTKVWGDAGDVQAKVNAAIKSNIDAEKASLSKFTKKDMNGVSVSEDKVSTLVNQNLKGKGIDKTNAIKDYLSQSENLADTINKIHTEAGLDAPVRLTPTPALNHTLGNSSPGTTLGNWLYDKGLASVAGHVAGEGIGAGLGSLVGHPAIGALAGEKMLSPVLTSLAKPLLENASRADAFKGAIDYATNVIKGGKLLSNATQNLFKSGAEILPTQLIPNTASRDRLEKSLDYASNENNALNIGGNLGHYMPSHASAAAATAATANNYLKSLKPVQLKQSPLDKPSTIDKMKEQQYQRALDIAQQPLLALKLAKEGKLQQQDINTLNTIYPDVHAKMVNQTFQEMTKALSNGYKMPYRERRGLSLLMGKPLDSTLSQPTMQTVLMANAPSGPPSQPQGQKKVSKSTSSSMEKVNSLYSTPDQARAANKKSM